MNIYSSIFLIGTLINLALGVIVLLQKKRDKVNKLFFILVLCIIQWTISIYFLWSASDNRVALWWGKFSFLGPTLIPPILVYFSYLFPTQFKKIKKWYLVLLFIPSFLVYFLVLSNFIIKEVQIAEWGAEISLAKFFIIFPVYFLIYLFYSAYILWIQYRRNKGIQLLQIRYLFLGIIASALLGLLTNIIMPILGSNRLVGYGPLTLVFFIFFTAYAITKHQLFNIKVIATELLVALVSLILLIELLLSKTVLIALLKAGILVAFVYLGISLIKSVLKEIKYREEIARAYEVEKRARKELQRLDKAKDQFLMATQHHLRTPLTSMRGFIGMLLEGYYGKLTPKVEDILVKTQTSTVRLIKMVNELLDISQFQLGKEVVVLRPNIQIIPLLKEVIEELSFEAEEKGIYLKIEGFKKALPPIKADPGKLKVALTNVIDNAIKYTEEGGVTITTEVTDAHILVIVKDTGLGIAKEEMKNLFTRTFERSEEAKRAYGPGRGIGLYLTAQIIKAHNGRVWAESEGKDKGSTFFVELPVS